MDEDGGRYWQPVDALGAMGYGQQVDALGAIDYGQPVDALGAIGQSSRRDVPPRQSAWVCLPDANRPEERFRIRKSRDRSGRM